MKRDFKSCMLYALFGLPIFLLLFIATVYFANCGFSTDCSQASLPGIIHTPIPTLIPAAIPSQVGVKLVQAPTICMVTAQDLLSAWVSAGYQETQPFTFRDIDGNTCQTTFMDVLPLFTQADLWYKGALACDSCHNSDISIAAANLDMSSYAGILAGGKRTPPSGLGEDILGGGNWEQSLLNQMLFVNQLMPFGHPLGGVSPDGPTIQAGTLVTTPVAVPTEVPSQEEVARPSNPGGPGESLNLTGDPTAGQKVYAVHCQVCHGIEGMDNVLNPGSDDGTIPPLNPIDSTLISPDYKTFAYNLDLFLQNGSTPEGPNAAFQMPAWGAKGALTQQQIADVIAYLISLNK
jgi:mono/diheme cytochrome c family protein